MSEQLDVLEEDLSNLEHLWDQGLGEAFNFYRAHSEPTLALAAALVEAGCRLQGLGQAAADAGELLLGDLCLARASRLLAEGSDLERQISFATVVETVSAAAASELPSPSLRALLTVAIGTHP
ncbi:MAG TPA: hypothetical protein VNI34_04780 [Candidatus Nitrosotalea sp.]|nr:hypothetical protein [Candidatus Nitrosotalea sp.]